MRKIDDGGHAFPVCFEGGANSGEQPYFHEGMSLRDYFAIHADWEDVRHFAGLGMTRTAARYRYADAMIAARKAGA